VPCRGETIDPNLFTAEDKSSVQMYVIICSSFRGVYLEQCSGVRQGKPIPSNSLNENDLFQPARTVPVLKQRHIIHQILTTFPFGAYSGRPGQGED
jgi:hypothetical protein